MKKSLRVFVVVFSFLYVVLSCSKDPFSDSTGLGREIVDDFDSSVTNVNQNIKSFTGYATIDSAFSMRDIGDSVRQWSYRNMAAIAAGTFPGASSGARSFHDTAYAYIEFRPGVFRQSEHVSERSALDTAYSIDSIILRVHRCKLTIDSAFPGRTSVAWINVFQCDTMKDTDVVSFQKNKIHDSAALMGAFSVGLDSSASDTVYSVKLDTTYRTRFQRAVDDSGIDTSWFAFCLKPAPGSAGVVRFNNLDSVPKITLYYRTGPTDTVLRSIALSRNNASFTVFESDSSAACGYPLASWETGRRLVYQLNVGSLREFMDTVEGMGKSYVAIQRAELNIGFSQLISDLHMDSIEVQFVLLDSPAYTKSSFNAYHILTVRNTANKDTTYALPVETWLQKVIIQKNKNTAFLYLSIPMQPYTSDASMLVPPFVQLIGFEGGRQLKLNAVITNPR